MLDKNLIIVDNFYTNAMKTRKFILTQPFPIKGNFPGLRTISYANESIKKTFEDIIKKKISWFRIEPNTYNGAFQYTTENSKSWIHREQVDYVGIIYLTPNAPLDSGIAFFRHKETGIEEVIPGMPKEIIDELNNDGTNIDKWEICDQVGNKFNRLVLFRGTMSHMDLKFFGKTKTDGNLIQIFYFNVENGITSQRYYKSQEMDKYKKSVNKKKKLRKLYTKKDSWRKKIQVSKKLNMLIKNMKVKRKELWKDIDNAKWNKNKNKNNRDIIVNGEKLGTDITRTRYEKKIEYEQRKRQNKQEFKRIAKQFKKNRKGDVTS